MNQTVEDDFRAWVSANRDRLRQTAYLLSGDWYLADDLVQDALARSFAVWARVTSRGNPDAYVRKIVVNLHLDHRRRPARREEAVPELPESGRFVDAIGERDRLLAALAADPPPSSIDPEAAIREGRRQHARRQQVWIGTAAAVALAAAATFSAVTGGSDAPSADSPAVTGTPGQVLPDEVVVTCTSDGIEVNATEIRTRPDGVAFVVSSSLPDGGYLSVNLPNTELAPIPGHEGAPLTSAPQSWTSALRPGRWALACGRRVGSAALAGKPTTITIIDPDGNWHGRTAIDALGCAGGALADWKGEFYQEDRTPEEAVQKVGEAFDNFGGTTSDFTAEEVQIDYGTEPFQTWVLRRNGEPYVTVLVNKDGDRFKAGPNDRCSGFDLSAG